VLRARALFLDFGGTLSVLEGGRTVVDSAGTPVLRPRVRETLARVRPDYDLCFIVSNQARVARGENAEREVYRRFASLNDRLGRPFPDWRICPHADGVGCLCRKPRPGMFLDLAAAHAVDLLRSTHVGDSEKDRDAASAAGIGTFVWADDFFAGSLPSRR
jgi:D-glycero-D-manno-heptose 1,7-bisphosphate phosphatase